MCNVRFLALTLAVALGFTGLGWGQASVSAEQQFASYHEWLSGAANDLLTAPVQPTAEEQGNVAPLPEPITNERFSRAIARVQQLRPLLDPILREHGVPMDVAAVVVVESGGRPTALSPKGALGLWQLMPETARRYGLIVSPGRDERIDPVKATRAAVRYLRDLYGQFGNWHLVFAAYNAGEQAVQRAILRSGSSDFQRVGAFLPSETRAYVPAVLTARPLFGAGRKFTEPTLRAARTAQVLYARALLDN